ncbi:MAG: hypothetical protein ABIJ28_02105 [Patescibacteria group bacterium]
MKYSKDFVKKVKAEYPDWEDLHNALATGNTFVGRYLDDSRYFEMSPAKIVEAFEQGREQDVLEAAKKVDRREKLYGEWSDLYQAQR